MGGERKRKCGTRTENIMGEAHRGNLGRGKVVRVRRVNGNGMCHIRGVQRQG